eukprot:750075-Hanusia_phi.AAC.4
MTRGRRGRFPRSSLMRRGEENTSVQRKSEAEGGREGGKEGEADLNCAQQVWVQVVFISDQVQL